MFRRISSVFALVLLFAFAQFGAIAHEISHYSEFETHKQQDENSPHKQCEQCISYAEVAGGLPSHTFNFVLDSLSFVLSFHHQLSFQSLLSTHYLARAPPQNI